MSVTPIPEIVVPGKRLGRHLDQRTTAARQTGGPPPLAPAIVSVNHASSPNMPLNQGDTGSCTGHAETGALNTVPHWSPGARALEQAQVWPLYSQEEELMGYGPYPPADNGGTGQYVCEAAMKLGWCSGFQVAADLDEALRALVLRPIIIGINWYDSFDTPDENGLIAIAPGATVRGGHEVVVTEIIAQQSLIGLWQSWGPWGFQNSGRFFMSFDTLGTLLGQGGDAVVPRTAHGWVAPAVAEAAHETFADRVKDRIGHVLEDIKEAI